MREPVQRQRVHVVHESDVYNAAMLVYCLAQQAGAQPLVATEVATVASELGMNIVRYAGRGVLTVSVAGGDAGYVDIVADDQGPGIGDVALALTEHYSSQGTLGVGLPGVRRMSDAFEIRSSPGAGTTVRTRRQFEGGRAGARAALADRPLLARAVWPAAPATALRADEGTPPAPPGLAGWQHATVRRPCFGEVVSGDGTVLMPVGHGVFAAILDVLGHGQRAHELARMCERWLLDHAHPDLAGLMLELHREIRGSLGAALMLAYLDPHAASMSVLGVGNTRLYAIGATPLGLMGQPGILGGGQLPRPRPSVVKIAPGDLVVFATDGISEQLDAQHIAVWRHLAPERIAQQMLREHGRTHDDATCMVLRCPD